MKTKAKLTAFLMLIPLLCFSQDDTDNKVVLDFEIGKFIALDLNDYDRLKELDSVNTVLMDNYKAQLSLLEETSKSKSNQIGLLSSVIDVLNVQLEAEKENKPKSNWFVWTLAVIASFGLGAFLVNF